MSIRNFKANGGASNTETTFESLNQNVNSLAKQIRRSLAAATELEKQPNTKLYQKLQRTVENNQKKIADYTAKLSKLRQTDPGNPNEGKVADTMKQCRQDLERASELCNKLKAAHDQLLKEEKKREEEEAAEREKTRLQIEQERIAAEAAALDIAAKEIVEGMTTLNEVTAQLNNKLDEQHEQILRVEDTMDEAHEMMVEGNTDLAEANEHQKGGGKCLCFILIGVVVIVVLIGGGLGAYFGITS